MWTRLFATSFSVGRLRPWALLAFSFCTIITLLLVTAQRLSAVNAVVTNSNDNGSGSLRQHIADAALGDTITFDASLSGQTIVLSETLAIDKDLAIDGSMLPEAITLSGNNEVRVMRVQEGVTAMLIGFIIANGEINSLPPIPPAPSSLSPNYPIGAGLLNDGSVILEQLTFSDNQAIGIKGGGFGGAIGNNGILTITNSVLSHNSAGSGSGIINYGHLVVSNSTFMDNVASNGGWAGGYGGAIYNAATLIVTNSTFTSNVAVGGLGAPGGGAIDNSGTLWLFNSTFSDNQITAFQADDDAGSSIANRGILHLYNTIIANGVGGPDCTGLPTTNINNLIEDGTCESTFYGDPLLGSLADHGGTTHTYDLLLGSAAIDAGEDTVCPATDQRGVARPIDGDSDGNVRCDIGAYEAPQRPPVIATVPPLPTRTPTGTPTPTRTPGPTRTYTPTPTSTATHTPTTTEEPTTTITPTITPSPTTEPYFDVHIYVHAPGHAIQVGETIPVTVTVENQSVGCLYAVYELTLSQLGDPIFHFDSPVMVGPPVGAQTVYTLTAVTPGRVALQASAYGERNCGDFWQWTYVNGAVGPIIVTAPLTATPTVTAVATIAPIATDTPTSAPTATTTPTPTLIATLTATLTVTLTVTPTLPATATPFAPIRLGDGNGDQVVDMTDLSACVQEIFDGDGAFWQDAPSGGYPGAIGCDANQDTIIDAGDLSCAVLLIANGVEGCNNGVVQQAGQAVARLTIGTAHTTVAGETVQVPITLTTNGVAVTAAAFRLLFDTTRLTVDPTDGNGDALPDALHFTLPALTEQPFITVTTHISALDIAFTALAATPVTWYDGVLLTVTLRSNAIRGDSPVTTTLAFDPNVPPSLGSATGTSIPVQTTDGLVQILPPAAAVRLYLPLIAQE